MCVIYEYALLFGAELCVIYEHSVPWVVEMRTEAEFVAICDDFNVLLVFLSIFAYFATRRDSKKHAFLRYSNHFFICFAELQEQKLCSFTLV